MYRCNNCKVEKTFSEFSKNKSRPNGHSHYCKACISARNKSLVVDHSSHYRKNAEYYKIKASFRKESVRQATPKCLTKEHKVDIINVYRHAHDCSVVTGEKYHVDHIVPLKGEQVCGLHVPWNLQVLPAEVNIIKSNSFVVN